MSEEYEEDLLRDVLEQLDRGNASKRARRVAERIIEHGSVTMGEITEMGYAHAARAVGDLRDAGIGLDREMEPLIDQSGRKTSQARYRFSKMIYGKQSRRALPKSFLDRVLASGRCEVCGTSLGKLQADHRVPFKIAGETHPHVEDEFMPLCASCNRSKSWECENCPNWEEEDDSVCVTCFWSGPAIYDHVATRPQRELRGVITDPRHIEKFDNLRPNVSDVMNDWLDNQND